MRNDFESCFAPYIMDFVSYKRQQGFIYDSCEYILHQFDGYCACMEVADPVITKDLINEWIGSYPGIQGTTITGKVSCVRQLSLYMPSIGRESYIPSRITRGHHRLAHVLSDEEICAFFHEVDAYTPAKQGEVFHRLAYEYKVLFRMLLCCGMRVSEARKLRKEDADLKKGILTIRGAKGQKDRLVYLPEDLRSLCIRYEQDLVLEYQDESEWFFPARDPNKVLQVASIGKRFNVAWTATVYSEDSKVKPTVHSLRHTFIVQRMNRWMEEGYDLEGMLPYLSKYLGHKSVEGTFYYYHQVDEAFRIVRSMDRKSGVIIPEVSDYEE